MKTILIIFGFFLMQNPITVVKNNGDELQLENVKIYQSESQGSGEELNYSYRGEGATLAFEKIKRISFKESIKKKKGITTYRVILVKSDNSKLEVEIDLVKLEGTAKSGKVESMNFSSVDKISF